jgi:hypothetical protein
MGLHISETRATREEGTASSDMATTSVVWDTSERSFPIPHSTRRRGANVAG